MIVYCCNIVTNWIVLKAANQKNVLGGQWPIPPKKLMTHARPNKIILDMIQLPRIGATVRFMRSKRLDQYPGRKWSGTAILAIQAQLLATSVSPFSALSLLPM